MVEKRPSSWAKHLDFMAIDLLCMQACFCIAYWLVFGLRSPYEFEVYRYQLLVITASQAAVVLFGGGYGGILRRGPYAEAMAVLKQVVATLAVALTFLFVAHSTQLSSRLQFGLTLTSYAALSWAAHQLNKARIGSRGRNRSESMCLVTSAELLPQAMEALSGGDGFRWGFVSRVLLIGEGAIDAAPGCAARYGVPCAPLSEGSVLEASREWVDEVFVLQPDGEPLPGGLVDALVEMGATVDYCPAAMAGGRFPATGLREFAGYKVITGGLRLPTPAQALAKRAGDIAGGLVGCLATGLLFLFVAPAIKAKSPGPVFFSQERVGRNGRVFRMYKFRSMRPDAERLKAGLADGNKVEGGMMFKMDGDPRVIPGVGEFIRRTSIDEFPQFYNVLKGDMSLVGTRPPTLDEWERYGLGHRARMAMKPGITGMWQVSGRSDITDFEEVVRLDRSYIEGWSLGLDFKILAKTIAVVVRGRGAE